MEKHEGFYTLKGYARNEPEGLSPAMEDYLEMKVESKNLNRYMLQYLDMMMCVASIICIVSDDKELLQKKKDLRKFLKDTDKGLYRKLRCSVFGIVMNLPGKPGRWFSKTSYHFMQKLFGFN